MPPDLEFRNPIFINTVGHTAGILLFGLIILLISRDWRSYGMRQTRLSLLAACLAFGWNFGALIGTSLNDPASFLAGSVMTASFAILSLLPAVLLQIVLRHNFLAVVVAGYAVSVLAVVLHVVELVRPSLALHHAALLVVVLGYAVLTLFAFLLLRNNAGRVAPNTHPALALIALLLFTSSFLHFGYQHLSSPWAAEVAWHHVGIPVALIVLLQDYRFLLLDTFLMFVSNSALAVVYLALLLVATQPYRQSPDPFVLGVTLVAFCLSLIFFAHLRNVLNRWIRKKVFLHRDLGRCLNLITGAGSAAQSEQDLLLRCAQAVANHFRAENFALLDETAPAVNNVGIEVQIPLRFSRGDARFLRLGTRRGGRRYLSEELADLQRLAGHIVQQVERFRAEELRRLVQTSELRALQAQINPHFLFNAFNTLYGIIDRRSQEARRMVLNLAEVFRYLLGHQRTLIQLSEEIRIVRAYLEIESLRLGDRLQTSIDISPEAGAVMIPVLSLQPVVENAVKHGIAAQSEGGRISLRAGKQPDGLLLTVEDSGPGFQSHSPNSGSGIGLENVRRRLALSFGPAAYLKIYSDPAGTRVSLFIPDPQTSNLSEVIGKSRTRVPVA